MISKHDSLKNLPLLYYKYDDDNHQQQMNAKIYFSILFFKKKIKKKFTWTFNEFGQTTNILSRIAHHNLSDTNDITDIGSSFSSIVSINGLSKSHEPLFFLISLLKIHNCPWFKATNTLLSKYLNE